MDCAAAEACVRRPPMTNDLAMQRMCHVIHAAAVAMATVSYSNRCL